MYLLDFLTDSIKILFIYLLRLVVLEFIKFKCNLTSVD